MKRSSLFSAVLLITLFISITLQAAGKRVLFIGDSITDGNWGGGGAKPSSERNQWDMNHIFGSGFMYLCASHYMGEYPEYEFAFFNRGISGNKLYDLANRWDADVLQMKPDVLSVLVGINDINSYMRGDKESPSDFNAWEKKYRELLDNARKENSELKIILGSPFIAPTGKMKDDSNFEKYNEMVHQCITIVEQLAKDYDAIYLPFQEMFDQTLKATPTSQNTYWIWDGIHPTPAGHTRMADMWIQHVDEKKLLVQ